MKEKIELVDFNHFLEKFPEVELPVTLGEDTHLDFSRENSPLPIPMIAQHIMKAESGDMDEFMEFIPCFKIPETFEMHAIVYWKAGLMDYQYVLATFTKKGQLIDRRVIGGIYSDGQNITQSVVTIDTDWLIYIATGQSDAADNLGYDPSTSKTIELELLADGRIINEID